MKRQYSFNQITQLPTSPHDYQYKPISQPYYTGTKQPKQSWTDIRVEQIKRKYQTPSHRKIISNYGLLDKNRQIHPQSQNNPFASYRNALRDSLASPNPPKKQHRPPSIPSIEHQKQDNPTRATPTKQSTQQKQYSNHYDKLSNIKNFNKYDLKSNTKYINKYKQYQCTNHNKIDPRVQNIDKINIKIKNILDCLHQNQFHHPTKTIKQPQQLKNSYIKKSINPKNPRPDLLHDPKMISKQKFIPQQHLTTPPMKSSFPFNEKNSNQYSPTPQTKHNNLSKYQLQDKYNNITNLQTIHKQNIKPPPKQQQFKQQQSWFEPNKTRISRNRSKSCLSSKKPHLIQSQQQYTHHHKKFDDQITKINTRIKQFQQQKKKLNIEFTPYHYQMKSNKSTTHLNDNFTYRCNKKQQYQPLLPNNANHKTQLIYNSFQKKYNAIHKYTDDQSRKQSIINTNKNSNTQYPPSINNHQPSKLQSLPITKQQQQINQKQSTPEFQQRLYKLDYQQATQNKLSTKCETELKQKTQSGISQRKKKLMTETTSTTLSQQQKIFIDNLLEQVKLDQLLRNAKIWYRDLANTDKEQVLAKYAAKLGIRIDGMQLQVTEQEDNPFYSQQENEQSYQKLIQYWQNSQKNWQNKFRNIPQQYKQILQKLMLQKIDLEKKEYCTIQDFVRFLNIQTGTFYRNRDLILIFRRISKKNKIQFKQFVNNFYL